MQYALERFATQVASAIQSTAILPDAGMIDIQAPKANVHADMTMPTFRAAKIMGITPPALAQQLADAINAHSNTATTTIQPESFIGTVVADGPYLNITLHPHHFASAVLTEVLTMGNTYGSNTIGNGKTVVIDYSSPNVAKRMHVGHIRSTVIGNALVHIYRALGYHVIGDNHLGDWGKQFGVIIAAMMQHGKPDAEGEEALAQLETIYAHYNSAMENDPTLDNTAREWSLRLEQGDPHAREWWQWCVDTTIAANQRNYDRLGVHFDHIYGESFYEHMLPDIIQHALASTTAYRDEQGAVVVANLNSLPTFLLQRSDGGTLYITRDIATVAFRMREFHPDSIIYVIGAPQELHLRQCFALARALKLVDTTELVHVPFGTIFDEQGKPLSTRKGNMIYLEALLDEAVARAYAIVEQKQADVSEEEKRAVAEAVGIGAVIYNDLYQDTRRNITLDWNRMLSTDGNSATYLQYSYARCQSILRKAALPTHTPTPTHAALLTHPSEQQLLKHISRLPGVIHDAATRHAPFVIADWCYTTAREFGVFFEQCPVLKAETTALCEARLMVVAATAHALHNGLTLLGITTPERM